MTPFRPVNGRHEATATNVHTVMSLEKRARTAMTPGDRISNRVTRVTGTVGFAVINVILMGLWIAANTAAFSPFKVIDPFPFSLLTLGLSVEAILLSIFVLMSENRSARQAERRAQLDLQINVLAEQELTAALSMLTALCKQQGVSIKLPEGKLNALMSETRLDAIVDAIDAEEARNGDN